MRSQLPASGMLLLQNTSALISLIGRINTMWPWIYSIAFTRFLWLCLTGSWRLLLVLNFFPFRLQSWMQRERNFRISSIIWSRLLWPLGLRFSSGSLCCRLWPKMTSSFHQQEPFFTTTSRRRWKIVINGAHYYPTLQKLSRSCPLKNSKDQQLWAFNSKKRRKKPISLICSNNRPRRRCKRRRRRGRMRTAMRSLNRRIREKMEFLGNLMKRSSLKMPKKRSWRRTKWWRRENQLKT